MTSMSSAQFCAANFLKVSHFPKHASKSRVKKKLRFSSNHPFKNSHPNKNISYNISEVFDNSSVYAASQISQSSLHLSRRIWLLVFVASLFGSIYKIKMYCELYWQYPIVLSLYVDQNSSLQFPAVSICNLNRKKRDSEEKSGNAKGTPLIFSELRKLQFCKRDENGTKYRDNKQDDMLKFLMKYYEMDEETRFRLGINPAEFVKECTFNGRFCSGERLSYFDSLQFGNCITFNKKFQGMETLYVTEIGTGKGLFLKLRLFSAWYLTTTQTVGAKVIIHNPAEIPSPEQEGFIIIPGYEFSVSLKQTVVRRLPAPYKDQCIDYNNRNEGSINSKNSCIRTCIQQQNFAKCGCIDMSLGVMTELKSCNVTDETDACCLDYVLDDMSRNGSPCNCPLPCRSVYYNEEISKSDLVPERVPEPTESKHMLPIDPAVKKMLKDHSKKFFKFEHLRLNIFYSTLERLVYEQRPKIDLSELLSYMGNEFGLWLDKDKCAQILLNSIGASNYNILAALIAPKAPNELPYDNLFKVLENQLAPKRSCLVSQHYFLSTYQKQDSSISDFVADLRRDIAECKFTVACECSKNVSVADIFLRAQFIRGIKDSWIKEQILQSELTDFNAIVNKAIALETSKIDCRELSKSNTSGLKDINKIAKRNRQSKNVKTSFRNQTTNQKYLASNYRKKTKKPFLDFEKLGINNLCLRCGNNSHFSRECRSNPNNLKCRACKSTGHVQKVCIKTILNANISNSPNLANHVKMYQDIGVNAIVDIYDNRTSESAEDATKYFISVKIENLYQKFEVDTGACYTLIPDTQFKRLSIKRQHEPTEIAFRSYTENVFLLLDQTTGNEIQNEIFSFQNITDIEKHFPEVCEQKVGCVPNFTIKLKLRDGTKPNYIPKRNVPYALREKVDKELDSLEADGIISKSITSDWGSPLVLIPKGDGTVRLCVYYKAGVNDLLMNVNYPIKKIDEVLNSLRYSKYFCKLDLFKVDLHLQTDEESSIIQTISTHRRAYKMNRLSFGIKTTPAEFNQIID
ncbi:Acid-sensing ion channel 3 [Araneus ventricosus]|uniref:Acid-sensing ion channel 3 n=1 Tax=Araneus ventricosus TaxID=182803 RepID=A0A4Y2I183_ARAVE|nr:Acid-sensing ion channel 3 [Araneus ventricosus]